MTFDEWYANYTRNMEGLDEVDREMSEDAWDAAYREARRKFAESND